jgi:hypothetical protein
MVGSLKPVAGDRVADRQRKEAEPDGEHDDVQHAVLPVQSRLAVRLARTSLKGAQDRGRPLNGDDLPLTAYVFEMTPQATL